LSWIFQKTLQLGGRLFPVGHAPAEKLSQLAFAIGQRV
jgi:hypothetical protein